MNNITTAYTELIPFLEQLERIGFRYTPTTGYKRVVLIRPESEFKSPFSYVDQYLSIDVDSFNYCTIKLKESSRWETLPILLMGHRFKIKTPDMIKEFNKIIILQLHKHEKFKHEFRKLKIKKLLKDI